MGKLKVRVYSSYYGAAFTKCVSVLSEHCELVRDNFEPFDLIVCPDYDHILPMDEVNAAKYGALIFHPSPLPRMRGRNAIKRQYAANDILGGGTWFWADDNFDKGDICEQEVCIIDTSVRPREYYEIIIIPIMERGLRRAICGVRRGELRKVPQIKNNEKTT